jgi:zinc transporter ZupT
LTDKLLPNHDTIDILIEKKAFLKKKDKEEDHDRPKHKKLDSNLNSFNMQRRKNSDGFNDIESNHDSFSFSSKSNEATYLAREKARSWRRMLMLVIAIVIHNFPEGMAKYIKLHSLPNQFYTIQSLLTCQSNQICTKLVILSQGWR